jgi:hypothetical protein
MVYPRVHRAISSASTSAQYAAGRAGGVGVGALAWHLSGHDLQCCSIDKCEMTTVRGGGVLLARTYATGLQISSNSCGIRHTNRVSHNEHCTPQWLSCWLAGSTKGSCLGLGRTGRSSTLLLPCNHRLVGTVASRRRFAVPVGSPRRHSRQGVGARGGWTKSWRPSQGTALGKVRS